MDKQTKSKKHIVISGIIIIAIGLIAYVSYYVFLRPYVSTSDAYVGANYISVTSPVSGLVTKINVTNNQYVKQGELLFTVGDDKVVAPFAGQISNCILMAGQYITAGAPQFALISYAKVWVDANFKETQLTDVRVGQNVEVKIDMYPSVKFKGVVASISGATGAVFALLPPQNATGNWVKVTQRVPVRIMLEQQSAYPMRIGTSANVAIKVE